MIDMDHYVNQQMGWDGPEFRPGDWVRWWDRDRYVTTVIESLNDEGAWLDGCEVGASYFVQYKYLEKVQKSYEQCHRT